MRCHRILMTFLLLLVMAGCYGNKSKDVVVSSIGDSEVKSPENNAAERIDDANGDVERATKSSGDPPLGTSGDRKSDTVQPDFIESWGKVEDPAGGTKIALKDSTLEMTSPASYVDNFPRGAVNAPRVLQEVSGDFTAEVKVTHVDQALPDSVLKSLGGFQTAYHAATLLVRTNQKNMIRLERVSKNTKGELSTTCELQVYESGKQTAYRWENIKDIATHLRLERRGDVLLSSYSQDDGLTWKQLPQHQLGKLMGPVKVGVSLTNNTDPGCTVKFQNLKIVKAVNN